MFFLGHLTVYVIQNIWGVRDNKHLLSLPYSPAICFMNNPPGLVISFAFCSYCWAWKFSACRNIHGLFCLQNPMCETVQWTCMLDWYYSAPEFMYNAEKISGVQDLMEMPKLGCRYSSALSVVHGNRQVPQKDHLDLTYVEPLFAGTSVCWSVWNLCVSWNKKKILPLEAGNIITQRVHSPKSELS